MTDLMEETDHVEATAGYVSCRATSKSTGKRCARRPVPGATVCRIHGGAAPQVQRKATLRLLELVDPAIATLARTMTDPNAPHAARLRAAENVLDRAGVPRKVDVSDTDAAKALLIERLLALRDVTTGEQVYTEPPTDFDVVTGEVTARTDTDEPDPDTEENP